MLRLIIEDKYFNLRLLERDSDGYSQSKDVHGEFVAKLADVDFIDRLYMGFHSLPGQTLPLRKRFNVELLPKGMIESIYILDYKIIGDEVIVSFMGSNFNPSHLNLKRQRLEKLKQINNV